ncbi:organomercurial lyase [Halosimplex amylolyticum]|uniref:organomercurial lyase n=1 Tax=Halosimplex amylolyticum TaxID=3396616 RepID=UPI003F57D2E1
MWIDADNLDGTEPKLSLADVALPPEVGDGFARLYGSDDRPETAAEWVATIREAVERTYDRRPTVDDLCTTDDGDHAFVGDDGVQTYICVLDPLVYPYLTGETGTVRSTTPVRETEVTFEMSPDGTTLSHDEALVSIGVSDDVERTEETPIEAVYREVCGYIQTFEDAEEYETWAAEVDASTTAVPAAEGVAVARALADALFDAETDADTDADGETGDQCSDGACC